MNPAERLAELRLLEHAVKAAVRDAETEAMGYAHTHRAKTLTTDRGTVTLAKRKPSVRLDDAGLLAWAKVNAPTEVVVTEAVRPAYVDALRKSLVIDGDDVLTPDGEVLAFATVSEGGEYLTVRLDAESKEMAAAHVAERLDSLLVREVEA